MFLQAAAVAGWWRSLETSPGLRAYFLADGTPERDLFAFRLPDLTLLALGSTVAALLVWLRNRWAMPAVWLVAGGVSYATLYCLAISLVSDSAWWSVALMAPAAVGTLLAAGVVALDSGVLAIRVTRSQRLGAQIAKTALQIAIVWGLALGVLPWAIRGLERRLGFGEFSFPGHVIVAVALFVAASSLGIWSAAHMTRFGRGTPLPFDTAPRMVVSGPYARIRNPMAVAGWLQATAVGLFLGSWFVLAYAAAGAIAWNVLARPFEESDLSRRFGNDYERYRREIPCWRFTARPLRTANQGSVVGPKATDPSASASSDSTSTS